LNLVSIKWCQTAGPDTPAQEVARHRRRWSPQGP
jgi:hypothetical protein